MESIDRCLCSGMVIEVLRDEFLCYCIEWDDGYMSVYMLVVGVLHVEKEFALR